MAKKELLSPQDLKLIFPCDDYNQMLLWLRDYCHQDRVRNSYRRGVVKKLVDKGYTVGPTFMRGQYMRYEDPNFRVWADGRVESQKPGAYAWDHIGAWIQKNGFTRHVEFMFDKEGNKYMCLGWKQYPNRIEVLTNKGLMFADMNGVLRSHL